MRSSWKIVTGNFFLWRSYIYNNKETFLESIGRLWQIRGIVLAPFIKKNLKVNRGNKMLSLVLKENMVGFSLKTFFITKKMGKTIHTEKKKLKKKAKKKGYIVNPIGVRLQFHGSWTDNFIVNKLFYAEFLHNVIQLRKYFHFFMTHKRLSDLGILFSHIEIVRQGKRTIITVFLYDGKREELMLYGLRKAISPFRWKTKLFFKKYFKVINWKGKGKYLRLKKKMKRLSENVASSSQEWNYKWFFGRLEKLVMRVCYGPFYNGLAKILERKAMILSILIPEVKMFGLKNNGMTSQLLGRFVGAKLKKGFTIMELMNPIRRELFIVKREEKGFHGFKFKFKGRFKRRNRSKKIVFGGGSMPLSTTSVYIDYNFSTIILRNSICGIKVWLCRDLQLIYRKGYKLC